MFAVDIDEPVGKCGPIFCKIQWFVLIDLFIIIER